MQNCVVKSMDLQIIPLAASTSLEAIITVCICLRVNSSITEVQFLVKGFVVLILSYLVSFAIYFALCLKFILNTCEFVVSGVRLCYLEKSHNFFF